MALKLWQDADRGLTISEFDANFSELAAGTLAQSAIDNRPIVRPTISINLGLTVDPRLAVSSSDYVLSVPGFNVAEGTFLIQHNVPSGTQLLSNSGSAFLTSQGSGKIALSYNSTSSSIVFNSGSVTSGSGLTLTASITIIGGVSMTGLVFKYFPKKLTDIQLQELTK